MSDEDLLVSYNFKQGAIQEDNKVQLVDEIKVMPTYMYMYEIAWVCVKNGPEQHLPKIALKWTPPMRRKPRRPKTTAQHPDWQNMEAKLLLSLPCTFWTEEMLVVYL